MTNEELLKEIASLPSKEKRKIEDYVAYLLRRTGKSSGTGVKKRDLRDEMFVGMWADREEMVDSSVWVRKLRETHWRS
jgi:hypothetical protein